MDRDIDGGGLRGGHRGTVACPFRHLRLIAPLPPKEGYPRELRHLGDHLKKRRLDLGLRQHEVAGQLGINRRTYENWEAGKHEPEVRYWPGVVAFLEYDPAPPLSLGVDIGERLRAARRVRGLSQEALARLLGIDESTVQQWEAGKQRVRRERRVVRAVEEFLRSVWPALSDAGDKARLVDGCD